MPDIRTNIGYALCDIYGYMKVAHALESASDLDKAKLAKALLESIALPEDTDKGYGYTHKSIHTC